MKITQEKGKWSHLVNELEVEVKDNESKPKSERRNITKVFSDFAKQNNTTASSASYYYYTAIRPNREPKKSNIDESISEYSKRGSSDPRHSYKVGDVIDIEIISITDFGVFGRTDKGFEGLIHISQITKEFVTLPEDYFYIGEKVRVKIARFEGEKINFSTRDIGGKNKINPAFRDLSLRRTENIKETTKELPKEEIPEIKEAPSKVENNDMDNIIAFIKKYSDDTVSKNALNDIEEMINKFGVFQTTMSLMETVRDLDVSSFITGMTKDRLEGERLRR